MDNAKNRLKQCLSQADFNFYDDPRAESTFLKGSQHLYRKEAAVLILLFEKNNEIHVLLTQRSQYVRSHKGEPSFPGGGREPGDLNPADTALRETEEEIGLPRSYVEIIGNLVPLPAVGPSGYLLYPVIGLVKPERLRDFVPINSGEVAETFSVPLASFLRKDSAYTEVKMSERRDYDSRLAARFPIIHVFAQALPHGDTISIYGITSHFCVLTACLVYNRLPEFSFPPYEKLRDLSDFYQIELDSLIALLGTISTNKKGVTKSNGDVNAKL